MNCSTAALWFTEWRHAQETFVCDFCFCVQRRAEIERSIGKWLDSGVKWTTRRQWWSSPTSLVARAVRTGHHSHVWCRSKLLKLRNLTYICVCQSVVEIGTDSKCPATIALCRESQFSCTQKFFKKFVLGLWKHASKTDQFVYLCGHFQFQRRSSAQCGGSGRLNWPVEPIFQHAGLAFNVTPNCPTWVKPKWESNNNRPLNRR